MLNMEVKGCTRLYLCLVLPWYHTDGEMLLENRCMTLQITEGLPSVVLLVKF